MRYLVACIVWLLSVLPAWAADECAVTLRGLRGTPDRPIVIDGGGITIDGMGVTSPMRVHDCRWVVVRNWNLCRSATDVLRITKSENCRFEQICAWNAASQNVELGSSNYNCIGIHESHHCTFIDCAAWGTGRKTICGSTDGDDLTWERCWARYDEPWVPDNDIHQGKPRMCWAICYNNRRNTFLDCIGSTTQASGEQGCFRGVFSVDRMDDGSNPQTLLDGCLALTPLDVQAFDTTNVPITLRNCMDGTHEGTINNDNLDRLQRRWATSPMLPKIRELAGVDLLQELATLRRPTPVSNDQTTPK